MCEVQLKFALKPTKKPTSWNNCSFKGGFSVDLYPVTNTEPYQNQREMAGALALKHLWQHATAEAMPKV